MWQLIDLLPIPPNKILKKDIEKLHFFQTYLYFSKVAMSAAEAFLAGELRQFDPHVGDTACQIRGFRTLQIFQATYTKQVLTALIHRLLEVIARIAGMSTQVITHTSKNLWPTTAEFTTLHGLDVTLEPEAVFVFANFFLSRYTYLDDDIRINTGILFEKLYSELFFCSKSALSRYITQLQRFLSEDSYRCLQFLALHNLKATSLPLLLTNTLLKDKLQRHTVPNFLSSYLILMALITSSDNVMLLCKMKNRSYLNIAFRGNPTTQTFDLLESAELPGSYFAIKGDSSAWSSREEVLDSIQKAGGLLQLLLATMAIHPQYSGQNLESHPTPFSFDQFSKLSEENTGWFSILYANMSALGEKYFRVDNGKYFRARHIFNLRL